MTTEERQQRMAERILEDENLRGDLEDDAATALIDWASKQAAAAAADPASTDAAVEAQVQAIRRAARTAALSGETAPQRLIALAAAKLAPSRDTASHESSVESTGTAHQIQPAVAAGVSPAERPAPQSDRPMAPEAPTTPAPTASPSAQPAPSTPQTEKVSGSALKPASSSGNRPRRKRSRLARFFKRILSGR